LYRGRERGRKMGVGKEGRGTGKRIGGERDCKEAKVRRDGGHEWGREGLAMILE